MSELNPASREPQASIGAALPPGAGKKDKDENDYLVERGPDALRAYMDVSEPIPIEPEPATAANGHDAEPRKAKSKKNTDPDDILVEQNPGAPRAYMDVSKPLPIEEVERWLKEAKRNVRH